MTGLVAISAFWNRASLLNNLRACFKGPDVASTGLNLVMGRFHAGTLALNLRIGVASTSQELLSHETSKVITYIIISQLLLADIDRTL